MKQHDVKVRLSEDVRARLLDSARANSRSLNGEINFHLKMAMHEDSFDRNQHDSAPPSKT